MEADRRKFGRADVGASALLFQDEVPVGRFAVRNLSCGGALIAGRSRFGDGDRVRAVLSFPDSGRLGVVARVVRVEESRWGVVAMGLAFDDIDEVTRTRISRAIRQTMREGPPPVPGVIVLGAREDAANRFIEELTSVGRKTALLRTVRQMEDLLSSPDQRFDTVIIDCALTLSDLQMTEKLVKAYELRAIVVRAERTEGPIRACLTGMANAFLPRNWTSKALSGALRG